MKIGISGNTKQTLKGLNLILSLGHEVAFIFGLPDEELADKVNSINLTQFASDNKIELLKSNDWKDVLSFEVDLIISLGDSRYVPPFIIEKYKVIGNHGAILPNVQGGASLVWGRMLNDGVWGVSLMELDKVIDNGTVLKRTSFKYDSSMDMKSFCEKCDDLTIELLKDLLINGPDNISGSSKIHLRVSKHIDTKIGVEILKWALDNGLNIYMPSRTKEDGKIKLEWGEQFIERFKTANDFPYPKYF